MLSIAIPVYNYNILPLVERLHQEASSLNIPFEILVCDDASTMQFQNQTISRLSHTRFLQNSINQHVASTRNRLLKEAQYPWVLLLDADVFPLSETFVQTYIDQVNTGSFIQGGFTYQPPAKGVPQSLRETYGLKIEQYKHLHSCCNLFFNQRELQLEFDATIQTYGYEDTQFFLQLQQRNIEVRRIKNPVLHQSTESNAAYLARTKEACTVLAKLIEDQKIQAEDVQLSKLYKKLKTNNLTPLITGVQTVFGGLISRNLLGKKPSMLAYKLFKLIAFHQASLEIQKK